MVYTVYSEVSTDSSEVSEGPGTREILEEAVFIVYKQKTTVDCFEVSVLNKEISQELEETVDLNSGLL